MSQLRIAMIGAGFMGRTHSAAYSLANLVSDLSVDIDKAVLVDIDAEMARVAADKLGWRESATDWREVVARDDIDVIDIVTPPNFHAEIARAAIEAGKHVFCEKPLTNDAAEAIELAKLAKHHGVVAQVGFNYRNITAITFAKRLWEEGRFGSPLGFRASYLMDTGFTVDDWGWRSQKRSGGSGAVGDIGSHIIDIAEYLFGDIVRVFGLLKAKAPGEELGWLADDQRGERVDEAGSWLAEFANGAIGTFSTSLYSTARNNFIHFEADGTLGSVEFDWNRREEFRAAYRSSDPDQSGFTTTIVGPSHPDVWWPVAGIGQGYLDSTTVQLQRFANAIAEGKPASPDFEDGAHVQLVVEAIENSMAAGTWVTIPRRGKEAQ